MPDSVHTRKLSRRTAIKGGAAVAVAAAVPSVAVAGDGKLLSEIADFRKLWAVVKSAHATAYNARRQAEADPDYPRFPAEIAREQDARGIEYDFSEIVRQHGDAHDAILERHGCHEPWDRLNKLDRKARRRSVRLFAIPAHTLDGVLAKTKLAHDMRDCLDISDADTWDIFEDDRPHCWTRQVQRDLERLAGGAA